MYSFERPLLFQQTGFAFLYVMTHTVPLSDSYLARYEA